VLKPLQAPAMKPGDTFTHDGRRLIAMQQVGANCVGCVGDVRRDFTAPHICGELPHCHGIVFIEDTPEGRVAYAAALLAS